VLLRLVDLGLASVIFVAPLFMGGRGDVGCCVYVALVCFTAVCWLLRQCFAAEACWRWSGAEWILLAAVLLVLCQLAPLPQGLLLKLSPEIAALLPLWTTQADPGMQLGTWNQLTLTPHATRGGLVTLLAHVMLFLVVVQRIRYFHDVERLLRWLAVAAVGMAVLGLAQFLLGNGKFLWIYEHPFRDTRLPVKGTFQNQNHFAHFLALGVGPLIWWLYRQGKDKHAEAGEFGRRSLDRHDALRHGLAIGLGLVILAGLLTFSRGGVIALFTASAVCLGILAVKKLLGKQAVSVIAAMAVLLAAALTIYGYEPLAKRLSPLRDARSLEEVCQGRNALWSAHLKAIPRFPLTGVGVGSHREIYRTYLDQQFDVEFTHGESGYLPLLLETGLPGLVLMLTAAALACSWSLRTLLSSAEPRYTVAAAAVLAGLSASIVHSLGDFVWYIPACLSLTIITAACGCRLFQLAVSIDPTSAQPQSPPQRFPAGGRTWHAWWPVLQAIGRRLFGGNRETRVSRLGWLLVTAGSFGLAALMLGNRVPAALAAAHWEAYFKLSRVAHATPATDEAARRDRATAMVQHLRDVVQRDPSHARAQLRLAGLYLQLFDQRQQDSENPMSLAQVRDAALASRFPSREAQDQWLSVALGQNRSLLNQALEYSRRAARLCPLQGEAYVYLAELSFLQGPSTAWKQAYITQAMRVRPYTGLVLLAAGSEAALAGDVNKALTLWKEAFHRDPEQRAKIIELLAAQMPPEMFIQHFAPDQVALGQLYYYYLNSHAPQQARSVGPRYAAALQEQAKGRDLAGAAPLWSEAAGVHAVLGDLPRAMQCAREAIACTPDDFARHRQLANLLSSAGEHAEAVRELQWCLSRKPDDEALRRELETVNRLRVARGTKATRQ
jgi:O-antigen ligase/tetratricopeptide (TPR) repeat protein